MLETLDHTIRIGSTPTFLYFDLYFIYCRRRPNSLLGSFSKRNGNVNGDTLGLISNVLVL